MGAERAIIFIITIFLGLFVSFFAGISFLSKLSYQSTSHGILIHVHKSLVPGGSRNVPWMIVEKFQYGSHNHTCTIPRKVQNYEDEKIQKELLQKKLGTRRRIWIRKPGHCYDDQLRKYYLQMGIGLMAPLGSICFLICCFKITAVSSEIWECTSAMISSLLLFCLGCCSIGKADDDPPEDPVSKTGIHLESVKENKNNDRSHEMNPILKETPKTQMIAELTEMTVDLTMKQGLATFPNRYNEDSRRALGR